MSTIRSMSSGNEDDDGLKASSQRNESKTHCCFNVYLFLANSISISGDHLRNHATSNVLRYGVINNDGAQPGAHDDNNVYVTDDNDEMFGVSNGINPYLQAYDNIAPTDDVSTLTWFEFDVTVISLASSTRSACEGCGRSPVQGF